jgi:type IV pilus assembly protein PilC
MAGPNNNKKTVKNVKKKAKVFLYKGVDRQGNKVSGELEMHTAALAKAHLQKQGIKVKSVARKLEIPFLEGGGSIKPMDIAIFTRQLATMMKAGVPLIQSFEIVGDGLENKAMAKLVKDVRDDVAGGGNLAGALSKHPKYFDELFCNLVNSGEQSGALETMLDRVATYKEKSEALKSKIKKAMTYPIAVVAVAFIVTGLLMVKVVPQFADIFESFGAELPAFTQTVINISEWFQANWFIMLVLIIGTVTAHKEAAHRSKKYRDTIDALLLKAPVVGNIVVQSVYARFSRTLSTTFAAGVPLVDALDSVAGAAGNAIYAVAIAKIRDEVTTGTPLNTAMRSSDLFPAMMLQMVAIGEESGALDTMLDKVANHYEDEVDNAVDSLTSLMEPLIMSVLGVLVGGLMVAMYMPIFQLGAAV